MDLQKNLAEQLATNGIGEQIFALAAKIYPICRSITGEGVRQTLRHLSAHIPLEVHEIPTGTAVFDWTIPLEWNIRAAYIKNAQGEKVVDFSRSNLHVVSYSSPVHKKLSLSELKPHIHTLPEQPDLIPYRTAYYAPEETWGFCMSHRHYAGLEDQEYEVLIDSSLEQGFLTYGEYLHRGRSEDEFLFSTHICHPSMANDNCSGIASSLCSLRAWQACRHGIATDFFSYPARSAPSLGLPAMNSKRSALNMVLSLRWSEMVEVLPIKGVVAGMRK